MKESHSNSNDFEGTWSKLENTISFLSPRRHSAAKKRPATGRIVKSRTISQEIPSTKPEIGKTSDLNSSFSSFLKPHTTRNSFLVKAKSCSYDQPHFPLLASQLRTLYQAKCKDLDIIPFPEQEKRFLSFCSKHFYNRNFDLMGSGLGLHSARAVAEVLQNSYEFSFLKLGKNILGNKGCIEVMQGIYKSSCISHVDFSSNELTCVGVEGMIEFFKRNQSIISLDISSHKGLHRNRLGLKGAESVNKILMNSQILMFLNLAGTGIGDEGIKVLTEGIACTKTLIALNVSSNNIGWEHIDGFVKRIVSSNIIKLELGKNKLGNEGAEAICNMLMGDNSNSCSVEILDISSNEITTKGLNSIFYSLTNNQTLKRLDLSVNNFDAGLSSSFSCFMIENSRLEVLSLAGCGIKSKALIAIPEALPRNRTLTELDLSANKIDDYGAENICLGLSRNLALKKLNLSYNYIKEKGGKAFACCFRINHTLQELNLRENNINDHAGQELENVCRQNRNLMEINLDLNPVSLRFVLNIKDSLVKNKMQYKQKAIPELRQKIVQFSKNTDMLDKIQKNLNGKRKEYKDVNKRIEKNSEKYDLAIEEEKLKNVVVRNEYEEVKATSFALSQQLDDLMLEIAV